MNRDEFNMLNVEQQVNYINSRLDEDLTLRYVIERELTLPRSTIRNRFTRNKYVFNKRANKYMRNSEVKDLKVKNYINLPKDESKKNITGSNMDIKQDKTQKTQWSNMEIYSLGSSEIIGLRKLLKHKDDILNLLDNNHVNKDKDTTINVSQLSGDLKVKTLKIYDSVLKEFNEFIKDHKEFKQQDIVSLALKEFLEKHK